MLEYGDTYARKYRNTHTELRSLKLIFFFGGGKKYSAFLLSLLRVRQVSRDVPEDVGHELKLPHSGKT